MNKKILRTLGVLLLITALVISLIPVSDVEAASSTSDFQIEGSKLVKYVGTAEVVSIPDEVRSISPEAFAGNDHIVKVTLNDKCKSIGYGAFSNCSRLHSVVTGNDLEEIGTAAFANDISLKNVSIGPSVKEIGSGAFAGDTTLTNLSISPANPHLLLDQNVMYNNDRTKVIMMLPGYINPIYEMPNSVNEIEGYAFWGNNSIVDVSLSANLYSVPEYAFSNCKNLKRVIVPLPVRGIDAKAFEDCVNLREVSCPESLKNISDSAFDGCPKVTLKATQGTYAYDYGQTLQKKLIDEIEYEDVDSASVVTTETLTYPNYPNADDYLTEVVSGAPENASNENVNGENLGDNSENVNEGDGNSDSSNNAAYAKANTEAKYSTGVINGADVVSYQYYAPGDEPQGDNLGSSSVVAGRALIFIDNKANVRSGSVNNGIDIEDIIPADTTDKSEDNNQKVKDKKGIVTILDSNNSDNSNSDSSNSNSSNNDTDNNTDVDDKNQDANKSSDVAGDTSTSVGDIIKDNATKGVDFPKFTVAGNKIASQSYYLDPLLEDYEFPENIKAIGDFAFARSALKKITIPDGVTDIGYGSFYHCENLEQVKLPDSVRHIGSYAFDKTAFVDNNKNDFVTVGDGILIAYKGDDSIVNIPEGVKLIADGTFRDHMGITAIYLPDSLEVVGEDAFNGCKNLKTLNNGKNLQTIGANAFKNTALSTVSIPNSVTSIGTGAFDLDGGTDTVTFEGDNLPLLVEGTAAKRLSNEGDRDYAFGNMKNAIINSSASNLSGTVLQPGAYGFSGIVRDEYGNTVSDNSNGVYLKNDGKVSIDCNSAFINNNSVSAKIIGDEGSYTLHISDSQNAREGISLAYSELYGGRTPENLIGFDMSLMDASDSLDITKLGKQYVNVTMDLPVSLSPSGLHAVCLDDDGQLEAVEYVLSEDGKSITLKAEHFSPYGFYNYAGSNADVEKTGDRIKDDTPDTGDYSIHPKWFLVIGSIALSILLFLLSSKSIKGR